jgi:hypothetical protein
MKSRLLAASWVLGLATAFAAAGEAAKKEDAPKKDDTKPASARVVSLHIVKPEEKDRDVSFEFFSPSTTVQALVTLPGKVILGVDQKASKLTSFTDDKKTDLTKSKVKTFFTIPWLDAYASISKDKHSCAVRLRGQNAPAAGASKIRLKASLVVVCGSGEKTAEKKDVKVEKGTKEKVGPVELEVPAPFPGGSYQVVFRSDLPVIKNVEFLDADGKAVKSFGGFTQPPLFDNAKYQTTYTLTDKKVTKVTVKLTYYEKTEKVKVPLDLSFGVGL